MTKHLNTHNNDFAWYKLMQVKGLGPSSLLIIYSVMVKEGLSVNDIFKLDKINFYLLFKAFGKGRYAKVRYENLHQLDEDKLLREFEELIEKDISIIPLENKKYPVLIKQRLKLNAPPVLFLKGNLDLLNASNISIVGSRNANEKILIQTKELATFFSKKGYNIVSGYAKGVDTYAHIGALEISGTTSVVLAQGLNGLTIKRDFKKLDWENNSLFISQFLPYEKWRGSNAMKRNQIVTALAKAVVVISAGPERDERGRMSGTFNAGKSALAMNIPVFVLSPSLFSKTPIGNKDLIKLGAIEFLKKEEILEKLI